MVSCRSPNREKVGAAPKFKIMTKIVYRVLMQEILQPKTKSSLSFGDPV
jgi:hypothetical protein